MTFTSFECSSTTVDGVNGQNCIVTSDLITISIYLVESPVTVSGVDIDPTSAKLDVIINKEDSRNLALIVGFQGEDYDNEDDYEVHPEIEDEDDKKRDANQKELSFGDHGYFSWVETATINDATVDVLNSEVISDDADGLNEIIFSFETDEVGVLYWDPVLAVKGTSLLTGNAGVMVPLFGMVAAMLVAL